MERVYGMQEVRAAYDGETITVYQAYNKTIGKLACENQKFVEPFSFYRMTWIKPSFLWLMERSNWGHKSNQECTLAIKMKRTCFEKALAEAVLTSPESYVYKDSEEWRKLKKFAGIRVQWDPERDIRGNKLNYRSLQVGISRHFIVEFNEEWIAGIEDISPVVQKIDVLKRNGDYDKAKSFLPKERLYDLPEDIKQRIGVR